MPTSELVRYYTLLSFFIYIHLFLVIGRAVCARLVNLGGCTFERGTRSAKHLMLDVDPIYASVHTR